MKKDVKVRFSFIGFMLLLLLLTFNIQNLTPYDPLEINLTKRLISPGAEHLMGTDELGRDIFSRILLGAANTLKVSLFTLFSSFLIGVMVGSVAGYFYDTVLDKTFNWVASLSFSLPFLLILVALMSLLEKNLFNSYLVMTCIIWVSPARIARSCVIQSKNSPFVLTERAMGKSEVNILFKSLVPMTIRPAFLFSFKYFPEIIGMEAGLSFLGLGIQPPNPGLGKMIFDSINHIYSAWWYAIFPALILFIFILISNLIYAEINQLNFKGKAGNAYGTSIFSR